MTINYLTPTHAPTATLVRAPTPERIFTKTNLRRKRNLVFTAKKLDAAISFPDYSKNCHHHPFKCSFSTPYHPSKYPKYTTTTQKHPISSPNPQKHASLTPLHLHPDPTFTTSLTTSDLPPPLHKTPLNTPPLPRNTPVQRQLPQEAPQFHSIHLHPSYTFTTSSDTLFLLLHE